MKIDTVFSLDDSYLTIYRCSAHDIAIVERFDFQSSSGMAHFIEVVENYRQSACYLLLDLSCEDYHEEQLPHVRGGDRKRLVSRMLSKYFSSEDFAHATLLKQLDSGRRDDLYLMSGIADATFIDPVLDVFTNKQIEIVGVYSLPLLIEALIRPVLHKTQVLLASCDPGQKGRYNFRQAFLDGGNLLFSRNTTVLAEEAGQVGAQFRKEIERTWQYLNNKRVLKSGEPMQVLMAPPESLFDELQSQAGASHCQYLYINRSDLASQHGYKDKANNIRLSDLTAFFLSKKRHKKSHYHPEKLSRYRWHQQINRRLGLACVVVALLSTGFGVFNFKVAKDIERSNQTLAFEATNTQQELLSLRERFTYEGPSPQKMQALVELRNNIVVEEALPEHVFSVLSQSFWSFDDLSLTAIEWRVVTPADNTGLHGGASMRDVGSTISMGKMDDGMVVDDRNATLSQDVAPQVIVNLKGLVKHFEGNYRQAIERIELLITKLRANQYVANVVAQKLPLDIDPSINTSRTLSEEEVPGFAIEILLKSRVL